MVGRRGTTLLELTVVMGVWAFILTTVLGFYVYASKVNRRNDQASAEIRTVQLIADKINTVLAYADIRQVNQFPATVIFHRLVENNPCAAGVLLPNVALETEYIGIVPDPSRNAANTDPTKSKGNALVVGVVGRPGRVLMQLPTGLQGEFRVHKGMLLLALNTPLVKPKDIQPRKVQDYGKYRSTEFQPMSHYFAFRGITSKTVFQALNADP